jgi:HNH endonuclease
VGEAKRRANGVGVCIYCGATENLSDEHILPYGLGGNLVLAESSCPKCSAITASLEQYLLRGHWWPYRRKLGFQTRRPKQQPPDRPITLVRLGGEEIPGVIPIEDYPFVIFFQFAKPTVLSGRVTDDEPSGQAAMKLISEMPQRIIIDGKSVLLRQTDQVRYDMEFDASYVARFLAKVGHAYLISRRGFTKVDDYFLPEFILGKTRGIGTYVGGISSDLQIGTLPGGGIHRLMDRRQGEFLSVYVQLFVDKGDPTPVYEIVVKRAA